MRVYGSFVLADTYNPGLPITPHNPTLTRMPTTPVPYPLAHPFLNYFCLHIDTLSTGSLGTNPYAQSGRQSQLCRPPPTSPAPTTSMPSIVDGDGLTPPSLRHPSRLSARSCGRSRSRSSYVPSWRSGRRRDVLPRSVRCRACRSRGERRNIMA